MDQRRGPRRRLNAAAVRRPLAVVGRLACQTVAVGELTNAVLRRGSDVGGLPGPGRGGSTRDPCRASVAVGGGGP